MRWWGCLVLVTIALAGCAGLMAVTGDREVGFGVEFSPPPPTPIPIPTEVMDI